MQILIDIDEQEYNNVKKYPGSYNFGYVIAEGIPLSEVGTRWKKAFEDIRAEIEAVKKRQRDIAFGCSDGNERYTHLRMEQILMIALEIIDKYDPLKAGKEQR